MMPMPPKGAPPMQKGFGKDMGKDQVKGKGGAKNGKGPKFDAEQMVWVGGVAEGLTNEDLKAHFISAGLQPKMVRGGKGGTGMVAFETEEDAQSAIAVVNGSEL